jgi:flagellar biosynthesis protein FlhF
MKIRRYLAPDIRQAMRMVREEQGPDAVILSNRKVDGGVEIIAARDFDEQLLLQSLNKQKRETLDTRSPIDLRQSQSSHADRTQHAQPSMDVVHGSATTAGDSHNTSPESRAESSGTHFNMSFLRAARQDAEHVGVVATSPSSEPPKSYDHNGALAEMHRELNQMRKIIDVHLAEAGWLTSAVGSATRLDLLRRLSDLGFSKKLCLQLANQLGAEERFSVAWKNCRESLSQQLTIADDNLLDYGGLVALVGPTGVGKTTTIAKLAARFRLKHGPRQIALVTTDNFRIGAYDQLLTYSRILDVPIRAAANADELETVLANFSDKRLVLIDTAGMGYRDMRLAEQFVLFRQSNIPVRAYLVLSAAAQVQSLMEVIKAFHGFAASGCILTKLDEAASLGGAISALIECQLPLAFVCDGQQVPEDLHLARSLLLFSRCFGVQDSDLTEQVNRRDFTYEDWVANANA